MARIVVEGLREFDRALKRLSPEVHKEFRARARSIAREIATRAKRNAWWSRRIPGAISPTVTSRAIGVRVSRRKALHGPLYERGSKGRGQSMFFRHPLFGNRDFWFSTPVRPFLAPAVEDEREQSTQAMLQAVYDAKKRVGLR